MWTISHCNEKHFSRGNKRIIFLSKYDNLSMINIQNIGFFKLHFGINYISRCKWEFTNFKKDLIQGKIFSGMPYLLQDWGYIL